MDLTTFATILNNHGLDPKVSIAQAILDDILATFNVSANLSADPYALVQLRAKLSGKSVHDTIVDAGLKDFSTMSFVAQDQKIQAIKTLRALTSCGLKEAKDAIEDSRIWGQYNHHWN